MTPHAPPAPSIAPCRSRTPLHLAVTFVGKFWQLGLALVCMPIYLRALGPEGFGVIGLYLAIQRIASLVDSGFSRAINRELASCRSGERPGNMLRTLEVAYGGVCALAFAVVAAGAYVVSPWLSGTDATGDPSSLLFLLMLGAIAAQLPSNFYCAAIAGLERHVALNLIQAAWQGIRFLGAAAVISRFPTLTAFFAWQIFTGAAFSAIAAGYAWKAAPAGFLTSGIRPDLLRSVSGYASGATLCAVTAVLMTQFDKFILFYQLPAERFGYYMVAWSLAATLFVIVSPITTVILPRMARLASLNDNAGLSRLYHTASQLMALAVAPLMVTGVVFSEEVLFAWLGDAATAKSSAAVMSLLFLGIGLNCLNAMPHALQHATGWVSLTNWMNLVSLAILGPLFYALCAAWGPAGAGAAWIVFAAIYLAAQVALMHRRLLPGERTPWLRDQLLIIAVAAVAAMAVRAGISTEGRLGALLGVLACWSLATAAAFTAAPRLRRWTLRRIAARAPSLAPSRQA
jgi:O-antigen/teichoic acid export membrane protein